MPWWAGWQISLCLSFMGTAVEVSTSQSCDRGLTTPHPMNSGWHMVSTQTLGIIPENFQAAILKCTAWVVGLWTWRLSGIHTLINRSRTSGLPHELHLSDSLSQQQGSGSGVFPEGRQNFPRLTIQSSSAQTCWSQDSFILGPQTFLIIWVIFINI